VLLAIEMATADPMLIADNERGGYHTFAPWHFLYFFPEPQGQGSLRPTFGWLRVTVLILPASSPAAVAPWFGPVNCIEPPRRRAASLRRAISSGGSSATTCRLKSDRIVVM